jgi:phage gp36-like protein
MFVTVEELKTHLYGDSISAISGTDDTIPTAAIDAAISEARGYLAGYSRNAIFSAEGPARNALLLVFVKDIAVWHYINLSNAGTELELRLKRYERAISWLKGVQKGDITPDLPSADSEGGQGITAPVIFGSNPKREQHF